MWRAGQPMNELRRHSALLEALQQEDSPSPADASRVRDRVMLQVGLSAAAAATASGLTQTSAAAGTTATSFGLFKTLLVVGGLAGATAGVGVFVTQSQDSKTSPDKATSDASSAPTMGVDPPVEKSLTDKAVEEPAIEAQPEPEETVAVEAPAVRQALPQARAGAKPPPAGTSHLAEEARLLSQAQAALQKGQPQAAILALNEHRTRFPRGMLSGEREAALTVAYCQSGDLALGQARASQFVAKNPQSPMVQRLKSVCKLGK